jgi:hypothetical protein
VRLGRGGGAAHFLAEVDVTRFQLAAQVAAYSEFLFAEEGNAFDSGKD